MEKKRKKRDDDDDDEAREGNTKNTQHARARGGASTCRARRFILKTHYIYIMITM